MRIKKILKWKYCSINNNYSFIVKWWFDFFERIFFFEECRIKWIYLFSIFLWVIYYALRIVLSSRYKRWLRYFFCFYFIWRELGFLEGELELVGLRRGVKVFRRRIIVSVKEKLFYKLFYCYYFEFWKGDLKLIIFLEIFLRIIWYLTSNKI